MKNENERTKQNNNKIFWVKQIPNKNNVQQNGGARIAVYP